MTTGKFTRRAALATGLSGLLLPSVVWPQSTEREIEGGIGGTGIVGVLTDFGSLIVSGNDVEVTAETTFSDDFGALSEDDIAIGDSLTIEAAGPQRALMALRVHRTYPVVGRIGILSSDRRRLIVNGVVVRMGDGNHGFTVGDRVAVSGLWRGNEVIGSRLSEAADDLDLVSGDVTRGLGTVRIGGVDVRGLGVSALANGSFASAVGRYDTETGTLRLERLTKQRFTGAAGPLARLSIEGYLDTTDAAPGYRIAGLGHSFERNLDLRAYAETRVLFNGAYTGRFAAESAVVLPETIAERRRLLRRLSLERG